MKSSFIAIRRLSSLLLMLSGTLCLAGEAAKYSVTAPGIILDIDANGQIAGCRAGKQNLSWPIAGGTRLVGCRLDGEASVKSLPGGGYAFVRRFMDAQGHDCTVTDQFRPTGQSIRWETEIVGNGAPWSTAIATSLWTNATDTTFWAPWSDPRMSGLGEEGRTEAQIANAIVPPGMGGNWADPLLSRPLANCTLWYGAPFFRYDKPRIGFCPTDGDLLCIPMVSLLRKDGDMGLSLVLSPQDPILDLTLTATAGGELAFNRLSLRISDKSVVRFAADLVCHEADWRGGLRWMTRRYPEYFDSVNPAAVDLAGTGAYSSHEVEFDVAKMKRMAFRTNWKASFDFPYMGLFLPPVGQQESWKRFGPGTTTISAMRDYAKGMREKGFYVLSYFNVTEFGAAVKYPAPARRAINDEDLWRDCNDFLYGRLSDAILKVPDRVQPEQLRYYRGTKVGGPYFTWEDAIVLDCGEPAYETFLLDQARRHIEQIPDAVGICIDRMDWLRMYNEQRDDGLSWFEGRPARSLLTSWRGLMEKLGPLVHNAGKVVFVNNHDKRIDLLRHVDGIFDEFTYAGAALNTTALLCVRKPALGWTADAGNLKPDPDKFFQKYLYLGVYPMAPFPGNHHSLQPSPAVERQYLDYGPLLDAMRGKRWVLQPHCVETTAAGIKVNLFEVPGGYVMPVTFGANLESALVRVRNVGGLDTAHCEALLPGEEAPRAVASSVKDGSLELQVPLKRGCAMVRIRTK